MLAYLLIGSYALMLYQWRKWRSGAPEAKYEKATVLQEPTATEWEQAHDVCRKK